MEVELGARRYDITSRSLVMGILNRTPDSFFDQGGYYRFDDFLQKAEQLVVNGADLLDVGGVKAGPGDEVSEAEELDRVVPAIDALALGGVRRAGLGRHVARVGGQGRVRRRRGDRQRHQRRSSDPDYLTVAAAAGASVRGHDIRLAPRVPDPNPEYDDLVGTVVAFCAERAARAEAGRDIPPRRIIVDAGLDLGKSEPQSLVLLRESRALVALG